MDSERTITGFELVTSVFMVVMDEARLGFNGQNRQGQSNALIMRTGDRVKSMYESIHLHCCFGSTTLCEFDTFKIPSHVHLCLIVLSSMQELLKLHNCSK